MTLQAASFAVTRQLNPRQYRSRVASACLRSRSSFFLIAAQSLVTASTPCARRLRMLSLIVAPETDTALTPIHVTKSRTDQVDGQANRIRMQVDTPGRQQGHQPGDYLLVADAEGVI